MAGSTGRKNGWFLMSLLQTQGAVAAGQAVVILQPGIESRCLSLAICCQLSL